MQIHTKYQFQCNQSIFLAFKGCKRKCQQKKNINPNIVYIQCVIEINTLAASSVYCSLISQIKSLSRKMIHFSPLLSMLFLLTMIFFFSFLFFLLFLPYFLQCYYYYFLNLICLMKQKVKQNKSSKETEEKKFAKHSKYQFYFFFIFHLCFLMSCVEGLLNKNQS